MSVADDSTAAGATLAPLADRLEIMINLSPEGQVLLNPFVWPGALNDLLVRQFGFTLSDLIAFLVLSFVFWKVGYSRSPTLGGHPIYHRCSHGVTILWEYFPIGVEFISRLLSNHCGNSN